MVFNFSASVNELLVTNGTTKTEIRITDVIERDSLDEWLNKHIQDIQKGAVDYFMTAYNMPEVSAKRVVEHLGLYAIGSEYL